MKPFHRIAVPHDDITKDDFGEEFFAAKLWEVVENKGPEEYRDAKTFFQRTYKTENFKKILDDVKKKLDGKGGNSYKHMSTSFGGGKTHTLIALFHECKSWEAKPVVLIGTELDPHTQTLWGEIEKQLEGKISKFSDNVPNGRKLLAELLEKHAPVLILIDELLEYLIKADGIVVGNQTLANQSIAFYQELLEAASGLNNVCIVATLPSSATEFNDPKLAATLLAKISQVGARMEENIQPFADHEIPNIIRTRLFKNNDEDIKEHAEEIILETVNYFQKENILPDNIQATQYRDIFFNAYPFMPQVIDVLYQRWGTFPKFQRTRGVLRLLSRVISTIIQKHGEQSPSYISLSDFDLTDSKLRREFVKHIGEEFNGIIDVDITGAQSGAKKVDSLLQDAYRNSNLGKKIATTIFLSSHSTSIGNMGANLSEIKRGVCTLDIPPPIIPDALMFAKKKMIYLHEEGEKFLFTKEINLSKAISELANNLSVEEIELAEYDLISKNISQDPLKTYIWPKTSKDVDDIQQLKLVIMKDKDQLRMEDFLHTYGNLKRINSNSLFFVYPAFSEKSILKEELQNKIATEKLLKKSSLKEKQIKELEMDLKEYDKSLKYLILKCYRCVAYLTKDNLLDFSLEGMPNIGQSIDQHIIEQLRSAEQIVEKLGPIQLKTKFLVSEYTDTSSIYNTMLSVSGQFRPIDISVLENCIKNGVLSGIFGLGVLKDNVPQYLSWKDNCSPQIEKGEVIINPELVSPPSIDDDKPTIDTDIQETNNQDPDIQNINTSESIQNELIIDTNLPESQSYNFTEIIPKIDKSFKNIQIHIECKDGKISKEQIEDIKRILKNMNAHFNIN